MPAASVAGRRSISARSFLNLNAAHVAEVDRSLKDLIADSRTAELHVAGLRSM